MSNPVLITSGDPAGCGPYVTLKSLETLRLPGARYIVVGDRHILEKVPVKKGLLKKIELVDCRTPGIEKIRPGHAGRISGNASAVYLDAALELIAERNIPALVTAPVSKEAVQKVRPGFCGHTEYFARFFKTQRVCMLMASDAINVVLLTRHIPLRRVPAALTEECIIDAAVLVHAFFKKQKGKAPRIAVASVNPHAGKDTFLEKEEKIIVKAIAASPKKIYGPYPSDTLFTPSRLKEFDCVLCCYHDQGMIPFKLLSFSCGVNVTLGLPIIRTSPAHGVAYDAVARKRPLMISSMQSAVAAAYRYAYAKK